MFKKILTGIITALVFLGLGIFIGIKITKKAVPQNQNVAVDAGDTYQAGWNAAKERLQTYMGTALTNAIEVKNVHGIIQKIDGNKLTVKINPIEPLADPDLDIRIITVDANTKISLAVQKDPAQYQKELQDFQDKMKQSSTQTDLSQQPTPFNYKYIELADLKENQQISATASENIKDKKEFAATIIDTQESTVPIAGSVSVATPASLQVSPVVK